VSDIVINEGTPKTTIDKVATRSIALLWSGASQKNTQGLPDNGPRIQITGTNIYVALWAYFVDGFYSGPNFGDPFDPDPIDALVSHQAYGDYDGNVSLFGSGHHYQSPPAPADAWPALVVGYATTIDDTRYHAWALADPDHEGSIIALFGMDGKYIDYDHDTGWVGGRLRLPSPVRAWTMRYQMGKSSRRSAECGLWLEKARD